MEIKIDLPDQVVQALKIPNNKIKEELIKLLALKLYEKGVVGIGKARELAGVTKIEFYSLLKIEGIDLNYDIEELEEDIRQLEKMGH